MGAKDIFENPHFVSSASALNEPGRLKLLGYQEDQSFQGSDRPLSTSNSAIDEEWHHKYAFIIGLLRKPHSLLVRESLTKERDKIAQKLHAYRLERRLIFENIAKSIEKFGSESSSHSSLTMQMKHLDIMCVTLERQLDVLSNVELALPPTPENIYSGEPDSLDGTSSEILLGDEELLGRRSFHVTINGRSTLDAIALLHLERTAHADTRRELDAFRRKYEVLRDEFDSGEGGGLSQNSASSLAQGDADVQLERVRDELTLQNYTLKSKLAELSARISDITASRTLSNNNNSSKVLDKNKSQQQQQAQILLKNHQNIGGNVFPISSPTANPITRQKEIPAKNPVGNLELDEQVDSQRKTQGQCQDVDEEISSEELKLRRKSTYKVAHHNSESSAEIKQLRSLVNDLQAKELEYQKSVRLLEVELKNVMNELDSERGGRRESEKALIRLEEELEKSLKRIESVEKSFLGREEECSALKLDLDTLNEENRRLKDDLNALHIKMEKEQSKSVEMLSRFEKEMGVILEENRMLQDEFNKERIIRKRYFNMVEELKGKIRVFCRVRPVLGKYDKCPEVVAKRMDPYTIAVESTRGQKEFQFDHVFTPADTQQNVFSETQSLIQSAFDGYNVAIIAYGQTGSGKTFTILGDETDPGIAPRTFNEIFSMKKEISHSYDSSISIYILELYNDKLIDLLNPGFSSESSLEGTKLEIRRDRKGTVWVSGARVLPVEDSLTLEKIFRSALLSRHTATTKMNDRSSRSHLIVGLIVECTSKVNGTVLRGKISLVDLAGSERTAKSGVSDQTLREANAINKSLSAFGDVINALTSEQSFVPYRNNKLTLLMQDSLGGNAKTLMFVNVSPCAYNLDETLTSLTYASRVKQVTNGAQRNTDSKEVARLRNILNRLKREENNSYVQVEEEHL